VREIERSAPSVEEAFEAALAALGASEQEVDVEVVQEPKGGFLRRAGQEAIVRVRLKSDPSAAPTVEELEEQADLAADFLEELLERMGIDAVVEPNLEEGSMYVDILSDGEGGDMDDDMALLIGRHGQTLDALQELTRGAVGRRSGSRCRVMVDVEDYRKRQKDRLVARARDLAKQVQRTGSERELEPMNAYERKIVHDAVAQVNGVESSSRGEDPERRVVIRSER
jgi:predicted RNA-binding protein Jag